MGEEFKPQLKNAKALQTDYAEIVTKLSELSVDNTKERKALMIKLGDLEKEIALSKEYVEFLKKIGYTQDNKNDFYFDKKDGHVIAYGKLDEFKY